MDSIVRSLFGSDAGRLFDLIAGEGGRGQEAADRLARSREWCGSTPGSGRADRGTWRRADAADAVPRSST